MAMTDSELKALKPRAKTYKVADKKGLYVQITPAGAPFLKNAGNASVSSTTYRSRWRTVGYRGSVALTVEA